MTPLRLPRDAFEAKAQAANDSERGVVVRRGGDANAVSAKRRERPLDDCARSLRHEPVPGGIGAEPIPQLCALMEMGESLEAHDPVKPP
jgi:hypothetical protein